MPAKRKYNVFESDKMVARAQVDEIITQARESKKGIFILEGGRGAGKTCALLSLYHHYLQEAKTKVFFVGLFPYKAPEFSSKDNIWLSQDEKFTKKDIPNLLKKITKYLGVDFIEALDDENRREYLAQQLAQRISEDKTILLVDSIYECDESVRKEIENNILTPLLSSNAVSIILSGRGKRPIWTAPEFREAQYVQLISPGEEFVQEQLKKLGSKHLHQWKKILDWSGGCPLVVRILGESEEISRKVLGDAVDILIRETLKEGLPESEYASIHKTLQRLALLRSPFRELDVEQYLFGDKPERRSETNRMMQRLLESNLLEWDDTGSRRGYRIDQTIAYSLRVWVEQDANLLAQYQQDWEKSVKTIKENYPSVKLEEYQSMITH